jgi:hypothetical protein
VNIRSAVFILLPALAGLVFPAIGNENTPTSLCVNNQSGVDLFFVVRLNDGTRSTQTLEHNQNLCLAGSSGNQPGTIAVFEDQFAMEGCTRLAKTNQPQTLTAYSSFDNCTWQNTDE